MRALFLALVVAVAFLALALVLSTPTGPRDPGRAGAEEEDPARRRHLRMLAAREDLAELREVHAEFLAEGEPEWAETCIRLMLSVAPQDDWANERAGRHDLREVYARIPEVPDLELYPNPDAEYLTALRDAGSHWGTSADLELVEGLLESTTRHAIRLRGDPVYRDEWIWRTWMSRHPIFKDLPTICGYAPPYLVFVDVGPEGEEASREILDRASALLGRLYAVFRDEFAARFELPDLVDQPRSELRIAKAFVFTDERLYRGYQHLIRDPVGESVEAHYRLDDQWIVLHAGRDMTERLLFTGVQQLLHFYRKILVDRAEGGDVPWKDDRLASSLGWFETGFARFLASARRTEDGEYELLAPNRELLAAFLGSPRLSGDAPVLVELLADDFAPGTTPEDVYERAVAAWSFCHFLWHHDGGRRRDRLVAYLGEELRGRSGPEVFARAFWGDGEPDWAPVEAEWKAHVRALAEREGIR